MADAAAKAVPTSRRVAKPVLTVKKESVPEEIPGLSDAPLEVRLTYVRDLMRGLSGLLKESEVRFLRYLLGMGIAEADSHIQASAKPNPSRLKPQEED